MKIALRFLLLLLGILISLPPGMGLPPESVLSSGTWHRLTVTKSGVYKLTYSYLLQNGIITGPTPASEVKIHGYGGLLPEARSTDRPQDLPQLPVKAFTGTNAVLDNGDYLLFYAQGPHALTYHSESGWFQPQLNIYINQAHYYITTNTRPQKEIPTQAVGNLNHPLLTTYEEVYWREPEEVNLVESGREWYGDGLGSTTSVSYQLPFTHWQPLRLKMRGEYVNAAPNNVTLNLSINNLGNYNLTIPRVYSGQYDLKGTKRSFEYHFSSLPASGALTYTASISGNSRSNKTYLNTLIIQASCQAQYTGLGQLMTFPEVEQGTYTISISSNQNQLQVWDIADPLNPKLQTTNGFQGSNQFQSTSSLSYWVFTPENAPLPQYDGLVENQNVKAHLSAQLLIVSNREFMPAAQRLADFRRSHDGLEVAVVDQQQVYNEFSSGRPEVTAIRDYAAHLFHQGQLKYLLLLGRANYDYKNIRGLNLNRLPIYESYNSVSPTDSYASDDFLGFLEEDEGNWTENEAGNQTLDIGIGRLPVLSLSEAQEVVDKLIHYSSNPEVRGDWRKKIAFVADDEDSNLHFYDADRLSAQVEELSPFYQVEKFYVDAYPQLASANGKTSPACAEDLHQAIEAGLFVLNYSGHGNRDFWTQERILSKGTVSELSNYNKLPLVVTATCDFGQHDGPIRSGAEAFLLNRRGGAIGLLTTSRPVFSSTNYKINRAFYNYLLGEAPQDQKRLGDIIRQAKNESTPGSKVANRNFVLLGDPSLMPAYPKQPLIIDELTNLSGPADQWRAHDQVRISGYVSLADSTPDNQFNGIVQISLYDKPNTYSTQGYGNNIAVAYTLQDNILFRGTAQVSNGHFSQEFTLPKNLRYDAARSKLVLYAQSSEGGPDAGGYTQEIHIGGSAPPLTDNNPPLISAYLNETSFVNGQQVAQYSRLQVALEDEYGINISTLNVGQNLEAILDDTLLINLNPYYQASAQNSAQGSLEYTLPELPAGQHKLLISAWDLNDNQATYLLQFTISEEGRLAITQLSLVPNPVKGRAGLLIQPSRSGDDYEMLTQIYSSQGALLNSATHWLKNTTNQVWIEDFISENHNLRPGVYIMRVILRSLSDKGIAEKTQKIIILH